MCKIIWKKMLRNWKIIVMCFFLLGFTLAGKKKVTIYLAGDSTMQTYRENETPMRGWGQYLEKFFDEDVRVVNKAIGGRSTRTFLEEERWQEIVDELQKGDWVLIQFGHNDQSKNPKRHTPPEDYRKNLIRFVKEARAKKARPVLLTSITMRLFDEEGKVKNGLGVYPEITRQVAEQMNVPLIDLNQKTSQYVESLGDKASREAYMWLKAGEHPKYSDGLQDNTHLRELGATKVAALAAEGIRELKLKPLVKYLKKEKE
jgi:lysophospholipase L1-like esterase